MTQRPSKNLRQRVEHSCQALLKRNGAVGPLELIQDLGFLAMPHVQQWKQGDPEFNPLQPHIQCGEEKLQKTYRCFVEWVASNKLDPFEATYASAGRSGAKSLQVSTDGDEETERFYRTQFRSGNLTDAKRKRLDKKFNKVPDLLVYQMTSESSCCHECSNELTRDDLILLKDSNAICLDCADMAHLEFLPAGSAAMTRRSKKLSPLSAVVMQFNRRRKRYQRVGILVTSAAINAAEEQCEADADLRAERRERGAEQRAKLDVVLTKEMTELILAEFPGCPQEEASEIATHTAERGSGRVGRSAAGRELQIDAIVLAVGAHVRHVHTDYDQLLMEGTERQAARSMIQETHASVMGRWRSGQS